MKRKTKPAAPKKPVRTFRTTMTLANGRRSRVVLKYTIDVAKFKAARGAK